MLLTQDTSHPGFRHFRDRLEVRLMPYSIRVIACALGWRDESGDANPCRHEHRDDLPGRGRIPVWSLTLNVEWCVKYHYPVGVHVLLAAFPTGTLPYALETADRAVERVIDYLSKITEDPVNTTQIIVTLPKTDVDALKAFCVQNAWEITHV